MNLPNKLTISRIMMTVLFLIVLFVEFSFHYTVALVLFVAASITDILDCLLYTSPSPRDKRQSRMPSSA